MPELTTTGVERFRDRLEQRREALRRRISEEVAHDEREDYKEIIGEARDLGDDAAADVAADLQIADLNRCVQEFREIQDALLRIQQGRFGTCIDCGTEIGEKRLDAWPTAKRCRDCQARRETAYAHQPTPTL